jgi:hypothetical protein
MQGTRVFSSCSLVLIAGLIFACNRHKGSGSGNTRATPAELDSARAAFSQAFVTGDSTAFDSLFIGKAATIDMAGIDPEPLRGSWGVRVFAKRVVSDKATAGPRFTPDSVQLDATDPREAGRWSWSRGSQPTQGSYTIAWRRDPSGHLRVVEYRFTIR